ncbi:hypothetical protein ACFQHN_11970 [Natrialbaceae archaeon GCM10025896]
MTRARYGFRVAPLEDHLGSAIDGRTTSSSGADVSDDASSGRSNGAPRLSGGGQRSQIRRRTGV